MKSYFFAKPLVKFSLETEHENGQKFLKKDAMKKNYLAMEDNYFIKDLNKDPVFDKLQDDIMHCVVTWLTTYMNSKILNHIW